MELNLHNDYFKEILKSEVSDYERESGYLTYNHIFNECSSLILCNNIVNNFECLELENGDDSQEVYQYYIIDDYTARQLIRYTNEIIYYHDKLDIYILGVAHYGTSWDYVLTNFKLIEDDTLTYKCIYEDDN